MQYEPLSRFPALRTRDVDELRQRLLGLFSVWSMDLGRGAQRTFEGHLNHRQMEDVGVTYARYGSPLEVSLSQSELHLQGFPVRGRGSFVIEGSEGLISRDHGIAAGPGVDMRLKYSSDFEHLILRIRPERLTKTLCEWLGRPIDPPLRMTNNVGPAEGTAAAQRRLLEFIVHELDRTDAPLPAVVLSELEQVLVASYLGCNRHNYSHLIERPTRHVASWQVRLAEDYVEQNWDQPVTIEALALATNTSVRSLFYSFKKSRGMTPMVFVRQIRLEHAREMLMRARPETTVTSVASCCGFSNTGHFARYYHAAFGEHPSATLRTARAKR